MRLCVGSIRVTLRRPVQPVDHPLNMLTLNSLVTAGRDLLILMRLCCGNALLACLLPLIQL
eukprot:SAG31_NODE_39075_length_291_cov_0.802083_1_plen_60_part_10